MRRAPWRFPIVLVVMACSGRSAPPTPASGDVAIVRGTTLVARIDAARALETMNGEFVANGVRLGRTVREGLRVALSDAIAIRVRPLVDDSAPGHLEGRVVVHRGKRTTLRIATELGAEEMIVLPRAEERETFAWDVELSWGLSAVRVRAGFVEVLDGEGRARFRAEPLFAVDAKGTRRDLTVRVEGRRLIAELDTRGLSAPIVVDPAWGSTLGTAVPHQSGRGVVLADGRPMLVGGGPAASPTSIAEIFDGATNSWTLAAPMPFAVTDAAAATTSGGKVLVAGGQKNNSGCAPSVNSAAALYDPTSDAWSTTTAMTTGRYGAGALSLSNGKVLVVGGDAGCNIQLNGVLFDPMTATWSSAGGTLLSAHIQPTLVAISGGAAGRVLVVGKSGTNTHLYDTATNTLSAGSPLVTTHDNGAVVKLKDGRVLLAGGSSAGGPTSAAEIYTPGGTWVATGSMTTLRDGPGAALFGVAGKVVVAGNASEPASLTSDVFDPATLTFAAGPAFATTGNGQRFPFAFTLGDGRALFTGQFNGSSTPTTLTRVFADALGTGTACLGNGACASNACVDGVCCDRACTGNCESCNEPGSVGTCKLVATVKHGSCAGSGTCAGACDGTSANCTYPTGAVTCVTPTCVGGTAQPAAFCNGAGACGATPATIACGLYACGATSCKTMCVSDSDCVASAWCSAGTCATKLAAGGACTSDSACGSGHCAGGVCCDKACAGGCETCSASGSVGTCTPKSAGASCGAAACVDGKLTKAATCDGTSSTCPAPAPTPCAGGLLCADATTCKTSCATGADCATGYCDLATGTCATPPPDSGVSDTGAETLPIAETGAPDPGPIPRVGDFQRCNDAKDCATGFCVEGVCCDSPCTDRCHSCALLTSPGKCTLEPVGVDLKNECGPGLSCLGTCGGDGECIGAGKGTMCARNTCTGPSSGEGPAYCAAPGAKCDVAAAVPFECSPYICEPAFGACRNSCNASDDCANGFVCDVGSKTCVAPPAPEADGGCSYGARASSGTFAAFIVAAFAAARARGARSSAARSRAGSVGRRRSRT